MFASQPLDGLWVSVTELAKLKGLAKSTVSEQVAAFVKDGKLEYRSGKGRVKLVNAAAFDAARGKLGDAIKQLSADTRAENSADFAPAAPTAGAPLRDAQTRKTQYEADLREIELKIKLGEYVPLVEVIEGQQRAAEAIIRVIERKSARAAEVAAAVSKDGEAGARSKLRDIAREERQAIAEALLGLAATAEQIHNAALPAVGGDQQIEFNNGL